VSAFRDVFKSRHAVLPVIHVQSASQAVRNATLAMDVGADGVFLINHSGTASHLLAAWSAVRGALGKAWVGLNILGVDPRALFAELPVGLPGVWVDNALIAEDAEEQSDAEAVRESQRRHGWMAPQLYFGGVAFKYQADVVDVARAAQAAARYVDVVTTSGPGTGQAADVEKIRRMKTAIGDVPLAIASGITPDNVHEYLPVADAFLVATGISKTFVELDEGRTRALVDRVRSFEPCPSG
jgi:uncharacterized protein